MNKYFEVIAKGGHVGRKHYYEMKLYITAENGKVAASIARSYPRVKHDHKDAILSVCEINYEMYQEGLETMSTNPYMLCKNKQQQRIIMEQIEADIFEEKVPEIDYIERAEKRRERIKYIMLKNKLRYEYAI